MHKREKKKFIFYIKYFKIDHYKVAKHSLKQTLYKQCTITSGTTSQYYNHYLDCILLENFELVCSHLPIYYNCFGPYKSDHSFYPK